MPNATVHYQLALGVATITLDRPDTLNSMTNDFMDDIAMAIRTAEADAEARVVVITGSGRGFCSGADLSQVGGDNADAVAPNDDVTRGMDQHFNPAMRAVKNCQLPVVARINGVAAGGGMGLALACDIGIAARSAFFVATFGPRLGIVPDLGSTWSLPMRAGRARAIGMAMLGDRISADQAADWGLIWQVVDDHELDAAVAAATDILKRSSTEAIRRIRESIDTAAERTFSEQLDLEREHQKVLIPMNMVEGAAAFLDKREPKFDR